VTLPIVWLPEADAELKDARAWYDKIRVELGERSPWQLRRLSRRSPSILRNSLSSIARCVVLGFDVFLTGYSSKFNMIGSW
jgi:hypothetical protein